MAAPENGPVEGTSELSQGTAEAVEILLELSEGADRLEVEAVDAIRELCKTK
jgi:hypothetical protein